MRADSLLRKAAQPLKAPAGLFETDPIRVAASDSYRLNENLERERAVQAEPDKQDDSESNAVIGPEEAVDETALVAAWRAYAEAQSVDGPRRVYTTLLGAEPRIEGNLIRFKVINRYQERDLSECKGALLESLRAALNNTKLQLSIEVEEQHDAPIEFLTERAKYDRMVAKNPLLDELRKRLDLDLLT